MRNQVRTIRLPSSCKNDTGGEVAILLCRVFNEREKQSGGAWMSVVRNEAVMEVAQHVFQRIVKIGFVA